MAFTDTSEFKAHETIQIINSNMTYGTINCFINFEIKTDIGIENDEQNPDMNKNVCIKKQVKISCQQYTKWKD